MSGTPYVYEPTASDLDGDALRFSIAGKPDWASFSESNGRLWGTPGPNDAGTYNDITITVNDGEATNSVGPFSITVQAQPPAKVSIPLNWNPPTENEDGSTPVDLAAYKIYWGTRSGKLPELDQGRLTWNFQLCRREPRSGHIPFRRDSDQPRRH